VVAPSELPAEPPLSFDGDPEASLGEDGVSAGVASEGGPCEDGSCVPPESTGAPVSGFDVEPFVDGFA